MYQCFVVILLFSSLLGIVSSALRCMPSLDTPGETFPKGDIKLNAGQDLEIYCVIDLQEANEYKPGLNASNIIFTENEAPIARIHTIDIVNETTSKLTLHQPSPFVAKYFYCKLRINETKNVHVCFNKVSVGNAPEKDLDFRCISYNWENLTCTWRAQNNFVKTEYELYYRPLEGKIRPKYYCPQIEDDKSGTYTCTWGLTTNPLFRKFSHKLKFYIHMINLFGNRTISREFIHFENVIPGKPRITKAIASSHTVFLEWEIPRHLLGFPGNLTHRIKYKSEYDITKDDLFEDDWMTADTSKIVQVSDRTFQLNLTNLRYAYAWYELRIRLKSSVASNEIDKWSKCGSRTFQTSPKLPDRPPKTNIGSFEIHESSNSRNILLFWQQIQNYERNGPNFSYKIINITENGVQRIISPSEITNSYVKYKDLNFNSYNFTIVSTNNIGQSVDHSYIFVPSRYNSNRQPPVFIKTAYSDFDYQVFWRSPTDYRSITSYTIFWCENDQERPFPCKGFLNWEEVPGYVVAHNVTVPNGDKIYQFAISANTNSISNGMVWASCTVLHNQMIGKINAIWIKRVESSYIEVGWELDCLNRIEVDMKFRIYYSPIEESLNNLIEPSKNITIPESNGAHGTITDLLPHTTYKITISLVTNGGEGPKSDPLYSTTKPSAPNTPPLDVKVLNLTNTTFTISWEPPARANGYLMEYNLHYHSMHHNYTICNISPQRPLVYTVTGLKPYTNYTVALTACTVTCSEKSPDIKIKTLMGYPEQIESVKMKFTDDSRGNLTWSKPKYPGGNLDLYEIRQMFISSEGHNWTRTYHSNVTTFVTNRMCEEDTKVTYLFSVRGVNIYNRKNNLKHETNTYMNNIFGNNDEGVVYFKGEWSVPEEKNVCFRLNYTGWKIHWFIMGMCAAVGIVLVFVVCARLFEQHGETQSSNFKQPPEIVKKKPILSKESGSDGGQSTTPLIPSNDEQSRIVINFLEPNLLKHNKKKKSNDYSKYKAE